MPKPLDLIDCNSALTSEPISAAAASEAALVLKALADPVRLRLVSLIASHDGGEACVCDLTEAFDLTAPTISHHLRVLREAGLVTSERRGTWVHYRVERETLARLGTILGITEAAPAPV